MRELEKHISQKKENKAKVSGPCQRIESSCIDAQPLSL